MSDPLLILGASTRAAAGSAIRAGLRPFAADLFCDDDLQQLIRGAKRVSDYPSALPELAKSFPPSPWMFTGALENHPRILSAISSERVLWGNAASVVRRVRDPSELSRRLHGAGLLFPEVLRGDQRDVLANRPGGRWIRKPFLSAGGGNMQLLPFSGVDVEGANTTGDRSDHTAKYYFQRVVDGQSQSAVFVAARGAAVLLGVTQQLVGTSWTGATGFRYAGSIGPLKLAATSVSQWRRIGDRLAGAFGLQGLFGVDAIVNDRGIWTIEVNPRYSSSIEVLEFGLDLRAVSDHVAACRDGQLNDRSPMARGDFRGKAVIYAGRDVWIDERFVTAARRANDGQTWPVIADIPVASQTIAAGHPVATVFVSCDRLADVEPRLRDVARGWRAKWDL